MAQSATQKRTPFGIEHFWEKPSADPLLKWEKWKMQAKLALLAKENIALDILLELKPETVQLPLEPNYENTITGSSAQSERDRLARNAQLKMNWENPCQKQMELGSCVETNRGHRQTEKQYQCYTSVWAPREDDLFVVGTRISRWTF